MYVHNVWYIYIFFINKLNSIWAILIAIILLIVTLTSIAWMEEALHLIKWQPHHHFRPIGVWPLQTAPSHLMLSTSHQIFIRLSNSTDNGCYLLHFFNYQCTTICQDEDGEDEQGKQRWWLASRVTEEDQEIQETIFVL